MEQEHCIDRPRYAEILERHLGSSEVKVLSGVRRCGKSTILQMFACKLVKGGVAPSNICYRRMDQFGVPLDADASWLEAALLSAMHGADESAPFYVFLDEVQDIQGWEKVVRRLHTRPNTDVYITGSNAYLLSSELSTLLAGRYVEIPVFPLSFEEYRAFAAAFGGAGGDLFSRYLRYGGMPGLFGRGAFDEQRVAETLRGICDTVVLNDVALRTQVRDFELLEKLVRYLFSNSGTLFSTRKVVNTLTSAGRKTNNATVDGYIRALEKAFVMRCCEQAGIGGKELLRPLRKCYPVDTGLRNLAGGFSGKDLGFQLECVVFNELVRRGYHVCAGALASGEVDFVAEKEGRREYLQVTASLLDDRVYEREVGALLSVGDSHPKKVLSLDSVRNGPAGGGVEVADLREWLLGEWE